MGRLVLSDWFMRNTGVGDWFPETLVFGYCFMVTLVFGYWFMGTLVICDWFLGTLVFGSWFLKTQVFGYWLMGNQMEKNVTYTSGTTGITQTSATTDTQVLQLRAQMQQLAERLSQLSLNTTNPVMHATPRLPPYPTPEKYGGDWQKCWGFLLQYKLYFNVHSGMDEATKLTHFMNFLVDKALAWASAIWHGEVHINNYEQFVELFLQVFDPSPDGKDVSYKLQQNMLWIFVL